jgi:two-component sensor histidine kinase
MRFVLSACQTLLVLSVLALALCSTSRAAAAATTAPGALDLSARHESVALAPHVAVLEDCAGKLATSEVLALARRGAFKPTPHGGLSYGYSSCTYWLRVALRDAAAPARDWLIVLDNPRVDLFELYRPGPRGIDVLRSGSRVPVADRPIVHRRPAFSVGPLSSDARTFYLRLRTTDVASFPLRIAERAAFVHADHQEQLLLGLYYGLLLFAALLNAFVFGYTREASYALCVATILSFGLFRAAGAGLDVEYLWPRHPHWNMTAIPLFCGLTVISIAAFSWSFLELATYAPKLRYVVHALLVSGAAIVVAALMGRFALAGILGSVVGPIAALGPAVMGLVAYLRGCRHAQYLAVAGSVQVLGIVMNALSNFALLPTTLLTVHGSQMGSSFFVVFLSLGLTARFSLVQREKMVAERVAADNLRKTAEAKLQALQAKINPHFLFNTLNTIAGLIAEAPQRAEAVVVKLSRLFRYTLTATEQERVPLADELAVVRSYLEIEQARFGDRLEFEIHTRGAIDSVRLPGLTLQPLVENSVKHGLRPKLEGGRIEVSARVHADACHLRVVDDGVGMKDDVENLGHGLASVRERLRLAYGGDFDMNVDSVGGFRIDIRIPIRSGA